MLESQNVDINDYKASFADVYNLDDPRAYFRSLVPNDYIIPHLAQNIFLQIIGKLQGPRQNPVQIVDLGCSYGINAALLKRALTWDLLTNRYLLPELTALPPAAVRRLDKLFFESWPARHGVRVLGIDVAERAVRYAMDAGTLDEGFAVDLERQEVPADLALVLGRVDLLVSTGCVGYVTEKTFTRLARAFAAAGRVPWVASFVLRAVDYTPIAACLDRLGLVTETLEGVTFVQRRFADPSEMEHTLRALKDRGIDPLLHEARGMLHAQLYLSRPAASVEASPIDRLLSVSAGIHKPFQAAADAMSGLGLNKDHPSKLA